MSILGDSRADRAIKILQRIIADARFGIRSDVGRIDHPHRGPHPQATGKGLAAAEGVAGDAIAGAREILAFVGLCLRLLGMRRGTGACQKQGEGKNLESAHDLLNNC